MENTNYCVFTRTWWRFNKDWPNGLEPEMGRRHVIARNLTEEKARQLCKQWNATNKPGKLSKKAEFTTY